MQFTLPDPVMHATVVELVESIQDPAVEKRLFEFVVSGGSPNVEHMTMLSDSLTAVGRALLLAKCVLPKDEAKIQAEVSQTLAPLRSHPILVELALAMITADANDNTDIFRDARFIPDALFKSRLERIASSLVQ